MLLTRERSAQAGILHVTGRDVEEENYAVELTRPYGWHLSGSNLEESKDLANISRQDGRRDGRRSERVFAIAQYVNDNPDGVTRADVAEFSSITLDAAGTTLRRLLGQGQITQIEKGRYGPAEKRKVSDATRA
jgi:hypothetical protein